MIQTRKLIAIVGVSALLLSPIATSFPILGVGAAFAGNGNDKGGGNSGGNGGSNRGGNGNGASKSADKSSQKSKDAKQAKAAKPATHPSNLGKMNGALNANISAVLAHIRNGQTTKGPVGLFAGLAAADSILSTAQTKEAALLTTAAAYDRLEQAIAQSDLASVTDLDSYFAQYDPTDPATHDTDIDGALSALGGDPDSGAVPSVPEPTEAEIAAAAAALAEAETGVADAEAALLDAANKDQMDGEGLLQALRDRLVGHEDEIAGLVSGS